MFKKYVHKLCLFVEIFANLIDKTISEVGILN